MRSRRGFTLVELVLALAIMAAIAAAAVGLLQTTLQFSAGTDIRSELIQEGLLALEQVAADAGATSAVLVPNGRGSSRDVLIVSARLNPDDDRYFNDPLFPRTDEDTDHEMVRDDRAGIRDLDDDGDWRTDEGDGKEDDDEDGQRDEDRIDGIDNDDDGSVDEDAHADASRDDRAGLPWIDDDGDGLVDEGAKEDDDEDGTRDEDGYDPYLYYRDTATSTLRGRLLPSGSPVVLCSRVAAFQAVWRSGNFFRGPYLEITLTLTADGTTVTLTEAVCPDNVKQRCGKRVI